MGQNVKKIDCKKDDKNRMIKKEIKAKKEVKETEIKCTKCKKRDAVVDLGYVKSDLCSPCFIDYFENRIYRANREFGMLQHGEKIGVGVSGGKDSAALLYVLTKVAKHVGAELVPILIDEGIKGYRDKAAEKAEALCKQLGLKLNRVSYQEVFGITMDKAVKKKDKVKWRGACSYCGVFRKTALNKAAYDFGCKKLAIGHNADDMAQTILMNFMKSEPARFMRFGALSGIVERDKFVMRVKPLIYVTEHECAVYCTLRNLPFHLQECPYSSDSFRGELKDFLNKVESKHPGTKFNILKSFMALKELMVASPVKEKDLKHCTKCGAPCSSGDNCKACALADELNSA